MNLTRFQSTNLRSRGLINDQDFITINTAINCIMVVISTFGVVTNAMNIRTFIFMGLRDGVSISLLGLALSDLGSNFFSGVFGASQVIGASEIIHRVTTLPLQPGTMAVLAINTCFLFNEVTSLTTTFLAVARCMCVAMPFRFKNTFTKRRSVFAQVVFVVIGLTSLVPVVSHMEIQGTYDPIVNKTRLVLWVSEKRQAIKTILAFIHVFSVGFVSTFVVFICVLVMAKYLRESVKFRNVSSSSGKAGNGVSGSTGSGAQEASSGKLSGKELQVVRQVMVISIIYTICMMPFIILTVVRLVDNDFDLGKRLQNVYLVSSSTLSVFTTTNSASTFLVYYVYNSKFRSLLCSGDQSAKKVIE